LVGDLVPVININTQGKSLATNKQGKYCYKFKIQNDTDNDTGTNITFFYCYIQTLQEADC